MSDRWDRLVYKVIFFRHETAKGVLLLVEDANGHRSQDWFPKRLCNYEQGDDEIAIPRFLALDIGLGQPLREYDDSREDRTEHSDD